MQIKITKELIWKMLRSYDDYFLFECIESEIKYYILYSEFTDS